MNFNEVCYVLFPAEQDAEAQSIVDKLKKFISKEKKKELRVLISEMGMLRTMPIRMKMPRMKIGMHYNNDLVMNHSKILTALKTKDQSGLILLHGIPGTGKSTYLRYLIRLVNKKVIFITPKMAANLDHPDNMHFLLESQNSIFIIEDAEELLLSRDSSQNSAISMLLNLTDGLLGSCLGIQVIATFNTSVLNIDPALLRKGRLIVRYEFEKLAIDKCQKLLDQMKINHQVKQELTLAELFNLADEPSAYIASKEQVGFKINRSVASL